MTLGTGTADDPWQLTTPPGSSAYTMHRDGDLLVCTVGKTKLTYLWRCVDDLHAMLRAEGDWVPLDDQFQGVSVVVGG